MICSNFKLYSFQDWAHNTADNGMILGDPYARSNKNIRGTYGSGGTAYGVFYNSHYFVFAYYRQVLGLHPALARFAITRLCSSCRFRV